MGETARLLGKGSTLPFRGITYNLAPLDFDMLAEFEVWLESRAWQAAKRSARYLPDSEQEEVRASVARDIAAGSYSQGSNAFVKASRSLPGQKRLLFLMMARDKSQDVDEKLIDQIFQDAIGEAIAAMERAEGADPNSPNPPGAEGITTPSPKSAPS